MDDAVTHAQGMNTSVQTFIQRGVEYYKVLPDRDWRDSSPPAASADAPLPVGRLRRRLLREKINHKPEPVAITGTFFPAALLSSGWWERQKSRVKRPEASAVRTPPGLRDWLQRGFEEWGPSWDFNAYSPDCNQVAPLFGQIADGDEVNSLPIIISGARALELRRNHLPEQRPFAVRVQGLLCHRDSPYLRGRSASVSAGVAYFGKAFQYVILVEEARPGHCVARLRDGDAAYTGYLWHCWAPAVLLAGGKIPSLEQVFFAWEHTDLSNPDALRYNLDSLQHKADYLQRVVGQEMTLLFKSSAIVPGMPCLSNEQFYRAIAACVGDEEAQLP